MQFSPYLGKQLTRAIKANTTRFERQVVSEKHLISVHTLNTVISGERKITNFNEPALSDIIKLAIKNANNNGKTLADYYQQKEAAEATSLNNH
jgi:hypothetical protein